MTCREEYCNQSPLCSSAVLLGNGFIIGFEHQSQLGENYILIVVLVQIQKLDSDLFVSETPTRTTTTTTVSLTEDSLSVLV